jgi:hypothetical protein
MVNIYDLSKNDFDKYVSSNSELTNNLKMFQKQNIILLCVFLKDQIQHQQIIVLNLMQIL